MCLLLWGLRVSLETVNGRGTKRRVPTPPPLDPKEAQDDGTKDDDSGGDGGGHASRWGASDRALLVLAAMLIVAAMMAASAMPAMAKNTIQLTCKRSGGSFEEGGLSIGSTNP
jgi:hypothetical protein